MLKNRIIPCLDVKNGRVVKGINFVDLKDAGDPVEQAKIYSRSEEPRWTPVTSRSRMPSSAWKKKNNIKNMKKKKENFYDHTPTPPIKRHLHNIYPNHYDSGHRGEQIW